MQSETSPADLKKIMALLQEYTKTLRESCQRQLDRQYRTSLATLVVLVIICLGIGASILIDRVNQAGTGGSFTYSSLLLSIATALIVFVYFVAMMGVMSSGFPRVFRVIGRRLLPSRNRYSYDARRLIFTLRRLVEMASQFSEHANRKLGDKFEFDLRLAEAEAVLLMAEEVFHPEQE